MEPQAQANQMPGGSGSSHYIWTQIKPYALGQCLPLVLTSQKMPKGAMNTTQKGGGVDALRGKLWPMKDKRQEGPSRYICMGYLKACSRVLYFQEVYPEMNHRTKLQGVFSYGQLCNILCICFPSFPASFPLLFTYNKATLCLSLYS